MKNLTLKELNDLKNNRKATLEQREQAKQELERRHEALQLAQELERFENSFWGEE